MKRASPLDLDDFDKVKKTPRGTYSKTVINQLAEDNGFPSRKSSEKVQKRRYRTGRDIQIGFKASAETKDTIYKLSDEMEIPIAVVLERAVKEFSEKYLFREKVQTGLK